MMNTFKNNILQVYGQQGQQWLDNLPAVIAQLAKTYKLETLKPVANMSFNYVAKGYQNGKPIILKLGINKEAIMKETECLVAFAHHCVAQVIASQEAMIIMQRAVPGTTLKDYFPDQEKKALDVFCSVLSQLHAVPIPANIHFDAVADLLKILDSDLNIPKEILIKARQLRDILLATTHKQVLLHGDLHHENILRNQDGWLVIDPKGFIGDPAFEFATYIYNPIPELLVYPRCKQIINNRIKQCATHFFIGEQRIRDWCFVKAVLSWAWSLEDHLCSDYFERFIQILLD